ncbi:molybdenum cofactor biosynthesis protein B [Leptolyngbya sp. PCC 6406]|uniref:MogA/MoaB family molybdenum cofactor biosynthesis protein n=1 Tax=Leptolyngbya sp. PCC 6406 TaxID=1173264 RepID=UPI0002AD1BFD|nr:MogA/MoaB family molybdenum cofactor biosynthesis protein [Leptolyngbya sp. PCC 6406]
MAATPHADPSPLAIGCAVLTVSDTRTPETDGSGQLIQTQLTDGGHQLVAYQILPDEPELIRATVLAWCADAAIAVILINGGTGIAPRDTTYDAIATVLEKKLPGFGELFRALSYQEIGSRAMASRAIAGTHSSTLIFSLPGSSNAVRLGMEALILPELSHLYRQLHLQ